MKKIIYLIISLFIFIPACILADMSGPMIREFKATPKSPNGAPIYVYDDEKEGYVKNGEMLEFGKVITVDVEESEFICIDEDCEKEVNIKDLVAVDNNYNIPEDELSKEYDAIAIVDLDIKKGPASAYESTGVTIKAGTKFKARDLGYVDEESKEFSSDEWNPYIYVNYNGTKGFVLSYEGTVGYGGSEQTGIASIDLPFTDPKIGAKIDTIKANTVIKTMIYGSDVWSGIYYLEYNGKWGTVDNSAFIVEGNNIEFTTTENLKIYDSVTINDNGEMTGKVIGTIPKGTKFNSKFYDSENWCMVIRYENGSIKGWIYAELDDSEESYDYYKGLSFEWPNDDEVTEETKDDNNDIVPAPKNNKMQIIYLCIGAALLISLTAVVTIIFVNRKKKVKNE